MTELRLKIEGMTCTGCAHHVEEALGGVPGAEGARVSYPAGTGIVRVRGASVASELIAAVERAGYRARVENGGDAATLVEAAASRGDAGPDRGDGGAAGFDLLVIGTGGAGMAAAIRGAELGARVAVVERGVIGGTCVNVGCIPSKNLIAAAERFHSAREGFPGIAPSEPHLDWKRVIGQKAELVDELRQAKYLDVLEAYPEITLVRGHARFLGGGRVIVDGVEHRARKIVIATGASPWAPPVPGLDEVDALDSSTAMELLELPESMIVLGAGYVGLELGQTFARFGTRVTLVKRSDRIAKGEEPEISEALRAYLEAEGLEIRTGVQVLGVERTGGEVIVRVRQDGRTIELRAERLLVAAGRRANTAGLGLDAAGVELDEQGFVRVDGTLRTTNPDIYAAGDVTAGPAFVYVAAAAGRVAAENALTGADRELDLRAVPRVMFTDPQVAAVGFTEAEARAAGHEIETARLELKHVPRAAASRDARGLIKVVAEAESGRILGVHALGPNAGELMGEATLAVRFGLTTQDLTETLHPYLTWTEGLKLAAQTLTKDVAKLSCCA